MKTISGDEALVVLCGRPSEPVAIPVGEEEPTPLSPMARRVAANKAEGRRLVDEVPFAGIRPDGLDR